MLNAPETMLQLNCCHFTCQKLYLPSWQLYKHAAARDIDKIHGNGKYFATFQFSVVYFLALWLLIHFIVAYFLVFFCNLTIFLFTFLYKLNDLARKMCHQNFKWAGSQPPAPQSMPENWSLKCCKKLHADFGCFPRILK